MNNRRMSIIAPHTGGNAPGPARARADNHVPGRKKILAVALEGERKAQALAMYDAPRLIVVEMNDIKGDPDVWMETMRADMADKAEKGWVVMVEDRTMSFSGHAASFNFDAPGEDGRTNLQICLDWYFAMDSRGQIILGEGMERFALRLGGEGGLIDAKNDERGRLVYNVDWRQFNGGHKALLMCVAGAVREEPLSERWINAFTMRPARKREKSPLDSFVAITLGVDRRTYAEIQKAYLRTEEIKAEGEK